jgi:transposase-like protein
MAPQEYSFEVRQQAYDLYVMGGLTFEQVAQATGVSVSQLKRWSAEEKEWAEKRGETGQNWPEARNEFRLAQGSAPRQAVLLRALLISRALESRGEFKQVLAAAMWEKTQNTSRGASAPASTDKPASTLDPIGAEAIFIRTPQEAVAALEDLVSRKINQLATQPGQLTFQAAKDLKQTLALIEELKVKYQPDAKTGQAPGLSDEAADAIRRQILGVQ